jgi:hypothetical protein
MSEPDTVWVVCCDDEYDEDVFDVAFEEDWESRRKKGKANRLRRYGTVRPSVVAAQGILNRAATGGEMPDVVLIDDWLSRPRGEPSPGRSAVELVRWIGDRFAEPPKCVLQTSRVFPPEAHAFCEFGGTQVIDKQRQPGWSDRLETVWKAVDGVRWRHAPHPPLIDFAERDYQILPYLDADRSPPEIAAALGLTTDQVHDARRRLYNRLKKYVEANDGSKFAKNFDLSHQSRSLADGALRAGAIWVPLHYFAER